MVQVHYCCFRSYNTSPNMGHGRVREEDPARLESYGHLPSRLVSHARIYNARPHPSSRCTCALSVDFQTPCSVGRLLCNARRQQVDIFQASQTQLFSPPNLLTTTSASLLANAAVNATALLLPAARIPLPQPRKLEPSRLPTEEDADLWPADAMENGHRLVFLINGQTLDADRKWVTKKGKSSYTSTKAQRRGDIGEGSMYI